MSIDILVPVLGRPRAIEQLAFSIATSTTSEWHLRFLCSPGDREATDVCFMLSERDHRVSTRVVPWAPEGGDWARKINLGYCETGREFLLLGATDLEFHSGWDVAALKVADASEAGVIGTNDLGNNAVMAGLHSTHPLVRRSYIDEYGTIDEERKVVHEGYAHQWVDTELVQTAIAREQWAFAEDSHVEHMHPFWHKSKMDSTYEKALSTSRQDQQLFRTRSRLWRNRRGARRASRSLSSVPKTSRADAS